MAEVGNISLGERVGSPENTQVKFNPNLPGGVEQISSVFDTDLLIDNNDRFVTDELRYSVNKNGKIVVTGLYSQNKYEWDKPNIYDVNWVDNTTLPFIVAIIDNKSPISAPKFFTSKYYYQKLKSAFESTNPNPYFLEESFRVATLVKIDVTNLVEQVLNNELDERTDKVVIYKNVFVSKQYDAYSNNDGDVIYDLKDYVVDYASLIKYIDWVVKKRNPAAGDDYNTVLNEQEIGNHIVNRVNILPSPTYDKFAIKILNQDVESFNGLVYTARAIPFLDLSNIITSVFSGQFLNALIDIVSGIKKPEGLSWNNGDTMEFVNYTNDPIEIEVEFSTDPINTRTSANQSEWVTLSDIFRQMESFIIPAKSKTLKKIQFRPAVDPISLQPILNARDYILQEIKNILPANIYTNYIEPNIPQIPSTTNIFGWPQYFNDNNFSTLRQLKPNGINLSNDDTAYRGVIKFTIKGTDEFIPIQIELRKQVGNNFTP